MIRQYYLIPFMLIISVSIFGQEDKQKDRDSVDNKYYKTYNAPTSHLLLEIIGGYAGGSLGSIILGTAFLNTNNKYSAEPEPINIDPKAVLLFTQCSALSVYGSGRIFAKGSFLWTVLSANALPMSVLLCKPFLKENGFSNALLITSLVAPITATVGYNISAINKSKKELDLSMRKGAYIILRPVIKDKNANAQMLILFSF